jgi:hypothetical protein
MGIMAKGQIVVAALPKETALLYAHSDRRGHTLSGSLPPGHTSERMAMQRGLGQRKSSATGGTTKALLLKIRNILLINLQMLPTGRTRQMHSVPPSLDIDL